MARLANPDPNPSPNPNPNLNPNPNPDPNPNQSHIGDAGMVSLAAPLRRLPALQRQPPNPNLLPLTSSPDFLTLTSEL